MRKTGWTLVVVGTLILAVSLLADVIGIGGGFPGIGQRQIAGAIAGGVLSGIGFLLPRK